MTRSLTGRTLTVTPRGTFPRTVDVAAIVEVRDDGAGAVLVLSGGIRLYVVETREAVEAARERAGRE